jgi:hypothetical protein
LVTTLACLLRNRSSYNFLNGIGIQWNASDAANPELIAQMLAKQGFTGARIEIGWNHIDFDDETKITDGAKLRARLLALKKYGIRPLILLNAHQGVPGPVKFHQRPSPQTLVLVILKFS